MNVDRGIIMKKIKILAVIWMMVVGCLINGCDAGLEIIGMEIVTYPDKLIYVAGVDTELNYSGGSVKLLLLQGETENSTDPEENQPRLIEDILENSPDAVETNIDFEKEGVYTVKIYKTENVWVEFAVQVVSKEWLEEQLERAG